MQINDIIAITLFTLGATGFVVFAINHIPEGMLLSGVVLGYAMGIYADRAK